LRICDGIGAKDRRRRPPFGPTPHKAVVHRTIRWHPEQHTVRRGVRVTDVNRTLIDYAAVVPPLLTERAMEDAFRRGYTNEGALRRRLAVVGGHGARGAGRLRAVLDARPEGRPARSGFEVMLLDVLRQYELPMPVRNYVVKVNGVPVAELDLAYPDNLVDLEADGARWQRRAASANVMQSDNPSSPHSVGMSNGLTTRRSSTSRRLLPPASEPFFSDLPRHSRQQSAKNERPGRKGA
jgi:hypothetical protein